MNTRKSTEFYFVANTSALRLDKALASDPRIISRSQATSLIDRGFVTLNNKPVKPAHKTSAGELFHVTIPCEEPTELVPFDLPLEILFEDEELLVVNKPSGLVVHPAVGHRQNTLVNALIHHTKDLARGFSTGRPGIVHRIDKDTSGLLVVAKSERTLRGLAKQFKNKTVHRVYWTIVHGTLKSPHGTITTYIRRHPADRKRFASERFRGEQVPTGKLAITHYDVKKVHPSGLSLIHCKLETGRTHQIRVHLSELGHPIVADPTYSSATRHRSTAPHLLLHAAELGFTHPLTRKSLKFSAPWPTELHDYLRKYNFLDGEAP